jgi:hypothetical protein
MWERPNFLAVLLVVAPAISTTAQQTQQTDKSEAIDIYITSYKGPPVKDVEDYHQGNAGRQFEQELKSDDDERYCLNSAEFHETAGLWEGNTEPSWWVHARGRQQDAEAYAAHHAAKHNQESALVFVRDPAGPDAKYVLEMPPTVPLTATLKALRDGGFKGAALAQNELMIVDAKGEHEHTARQVAEALGAKMTTTRGRMRLIMLREYAAVFERYKTNPGFCSPSKR